jgi:hypothetical protein
MTNIVDLDREREINTLINKLGSLISVDSTLNKRTFDYLNGELATMDTDKTRTVSVRFPIELLNWIDSYSRIAAVNQESRVTRTMVVVNFLEMAKAAIEYREKHEWGNSHQDEIKKVVESINANNGEQQ